MGIYEYNENALKIYQAYMGKLHIVQAVPVRTCVRVGRPMPVQ